MKRDPLIRSLSFLICTGLLFCSAGSIGADTMRGDITVERPWTRVSPKAATTGTAYMTITNRGTKADRLISAKSDGEQRVDLHVMTMVENIMRMRPVEGGIPISAKGTFTFEPAGGYHLMLIGLREPSQVGERIPLSLQFKNAGWLTVELLVEPLSRRDQTPAEQPDRTLDSSP